jgi:lysylphosphatidylglycerol synthetase-like protein (DUF2156 family)
MKIKSEIKNGYFIFISIATYFLIMEFLGLAHLFYLRLFNILIVLYAVNKTIQTKIAHGKKSFLPIAIAATVTSLVGVLLSIIGLLVYSHMRGGDKYTSTLSETFLFGGHPSINSYCFSLFFEGIASSVVVTMLLMLYYNDQFTAD